MARPENRSEARALSLTLPVETFNYLALLATLGKLGRTENEVATHILVREVYVMLRQTAPADEPHPAAGRRERVSAIGGLFDAEQFDVEDQRRVRRNDAAGAARAIAELGRDDQRALAADLHGGDAFVPAGDDLVLADRKLERLAAIDRSSRISCPWRRSRRASRCNA